jgi:hypothetical protein
LLAVANQGRISQGLTTLDGISGTLPKLYTAPAADFHDITTGNNGFAAGTGYDLASGIGSPVANKLIPYLAGISSSGGVALTSGNNTAILRRDTDGIHADVIVNGVQTSQLSLSQSSPFTVTGGTGNDTLTFDFSKGDPLPAGGATVNGGTGANIITVTGTTGNDAVAVGLSSMTVTTSAVSNVPISFSNVHEVSFPGGSGGADSLTFNGTTIQANADTPTASGAANVSVSVQGGSSITFVSDQHLAGLTVNGSTVALPSAGAVLALSGALSLVTSGKLDLTKGQLTVTSATTALSVIQGYLTSGYSGGNWNGTSGIVSSAAATSGKTKSLGYASSGDPVAITIPSGQIVVKYTSAGDADLSGTTDFNDFLALQNNFNKAGNWAHGNFDYSSLTDFNDFLILQNNFNH